MRKKSLIMVMALAVVLVFAGIASAAQAFNVSFPVNFSVYDDCTGEVVDVTGNNHIQANVTGNNNSLHLSFHANFQGLSGVGEESGTMYTGNGVLNASLNFNNQATNFIILGHFKLLGQGQTPDLIVYGRFHITVNAQGDITGVNFEPLTAECKPAP